MFISEIVKEFRKGKTIELQPVSVYKMECPYCGEESLRIFLCKNKIHYKTWKYIDNGGYVYIDGHNVLKIEKGIPMKNNQFDVEFLTGLCRNCGINFYALSIDIVNKPTRESKFIIVDEGILNHENIQSKLFSISINKIVIGCLTVFRDIKCSDGDNYDLYRIQLENFKLDFINDDANAYELSTFVINDFINNSDFDLVF